MDTNDRLMDPNCKKSDEAVRKVGKVKKAMIEISVGMYQSTMRAKGRNTKRQMKNNKALNIVNKS